jgi:acyl-CoA thioesterase I
MALTTSLMAKWSASQTAILALAWLAIAVVCAVGAAVAEPIVNCGEAGETSQNAAALPSMAKALRERKRIRVLAVGSAPLSSRSDAKGYYARVESFLERSYKGLEVDILDAGVSVELARDAFGRLQNEVALTQPDVVFWQVGVADAMARTSPQELKATLVDAIVWLKDHNVDVVLIGMRYIRSMARDKHYQEVRQAIRDAQREQSILRVGHYEAIEAVDQIRRRKGQAPTELDLTDSGAVCMADFLSRALAAKLFSKTAPPANGLTDVDSSKPDPTSGGTGGGPAPPAPR